MIGSNIIVEQTIRIGLQQVCNNSENISTEVLSCCCIHAKYNCILKAGITAAPGAVLYSTNLLCVHPEQDHPGNLPAFK
jgi:hypothetical protein